MQRRDIVLLFRNLDNSESSNPLIRMWKNHKLMLASYGLAILKEWQRRGNLSIEWREFETELNKLRGIRSARTLPSWLMDERLFNSHQAWLVREDPDFYNPLFGPIQDPNQELFWPEDQS